MSKPSSSQRPRSNNRSSIALKNKLSIYRRKLISWSRKKPYFEYNHDVDNIEFYIGIYAEDLRKNSALSPLVGRLIGIDAFSQVLTNPLLAESIFNSETFSPVGWDEIQNIKALSDLLHRNIPQTGKKYRVSFYQENWQPA